MRPDQDPQPTHAAGLAATAAGGEEFSAALAVLSDALTALGRDRDTCDLLLDLTNLLRPPQPSTTTGDRRAAALAVVDGRLPVVHARGQRQLLDALLDVKVALERPGGGP